MFSGLWKLLLYYCRRPDLQNAFPEVKEGDLNGLIRWASFASQNLYDDSEAFEYLKKHYDFFYFASKYENFLPNPNFKNLPKLFLILGAGRSGTTLLKRIMCCHSLTSALDEGRVYHGINYPILMKLQRIFESKKLWLGLKAPALTDCLLDNNFIAFPIPEHTDEISEKFRKFYANEPIIFLVRDVRDRVSSIIEQGKKTNVNLQGLSTLIEGWVRKNPYIQENFSEELSKIKKFKDKIYGYEALDWKIKTSAYYAYKERGLPILLVKYEDLVSKTEETLRNITTFLEIPFEKSLLDFNKIPQTDLRAPGLAQNFDNTKRVADTSSIGLHKRHLSDGQTNEIMEITSDMMRNLNYLK